MARKAVRPLVLAAVRANCRTALAENIVRIFIGYIEFTDYFMNLKL